MAKWRLTCGGASPARMICLAFLGMTVTGSVWCQPTQSTPQAQSVPATGQLIPAPRVHVDDTWTYHTEGRNKAGWHEAHYTMTVRRVDASVVVLEIKTLGSDLPPIERMFPIDWSIERNVNGRQMITNHPLDFPLHVGKGWKTDYTENQPNRLVLSEHFILPYKVTGWEDVTVPAGTFHALKIEAEGEWSAVTAPATGSLVSSRADANGTTTVTQTQKPIGHTISGHTYRAIWYVPAIKRWVKIDAELYNPNGVRIQYSVDELESYKVQ